MSPTRTILDVCGLDHPAIRALVDHRVSDRVLLDFKICPILPTAGRPPRLYLSWDGEKRRWIDRVRALFPGPAVDAFLAEVPAGCRRMIDTDGVSAELYLDDLHLHDHPEMCRILHLPSLRRSTLLPAHTAPPAVSPLLAPFQALGGLLAVRHGGPVPRAVWVSEGRWNGRAGEARSLLQQQGLLPRTFLELESALAPLGLRLYVDALDAWEGAIDITVGLLAPGRTARAPS